MAKEFGRFTVTIGTGATALKYSLRLPKATYGSSGVGAILGIQPATNEDNFNGIGSINDLRRAGLILRVKARTAASGTTKARTYSLWCVAANVPNAVAKLPLQTIEGANVVSAGATLPTRRH